MKLSLKKKFGYVHVRAGELLKVSVPHAVPTSTRTGSQKDWTRPPDDGKWLYCDEGDLALELVAVKTDKVLGHAYLTGRAVQLHRYGQPQSDWFEPATLVHAELPDPPTSGAQAERFFQKFIGKLMEYKYGDAELVAFKAKGGENEEHLQGFGSFMQDAWSFAPHDKDGNKLEGVEPRAHLVVLAEAASGATCVLHFQPPRHANPDLCMTHFQAELIVEAAERKAAK